MSSANFTASGNEIGAKENRKLWIHYEITRLYKHGRQKSISMCKPHGGWPTRARPPRSPTPVSQEWENLRLQLAQTLQIWTSED